MLRRCYCLCLSTWCLLSQSNAFLSNKKKSITSFSNHQGRFPGRRKYYNTLAARNDNRPKQNYNSTHQQNDARRQAIIRNKKISEIGRQQNWQGLLRMHDKEGRFFDNVNYATMMSQLGRMYKSVYHKDILFINFMKDLADIMERKGLQWIGARETANIVYSISKMQLKSIESTSIIELVSKKENVEWLVGTGSPQAVSNTAWSFGKLGFSKRLFQEIEKRPRRLVEKGKPQEIANTAWAFAKLRIEAPNLFAQIEKRSEWLVKEGSPQAVANTIWAFATLKVRAPNLCKEIENQVETFVSEEISTQAIGNIAWSFASLGYKSVKTFTEIEKYAGWLVIEGSKQEIANIAWSYATLDIKSPRMFTEIEERAELIVKHANTQDVSNIAWAFAVLDSVSSPRLFTEIEKHAEWIVREGNLQDMANVLWASSRLKYYTPNLVAQADRRCERLVTGESLPKTLKGISTIAMSFALVGYRATYFFAALEENLDEFLDYVTEQDTCNICYALAILDLGKKHMRLLSVLWDKAMSMDTRDFTILGLNQLCQVYEFTKVEGINLEVPSQEILEQMSDGLYDETQSRYQKKISALLTGLGFVHEEEVSSLADTGRGGILSIDMASRKQKVAIEYDGPSHFLVSLPLGDLSDTADGPTMAKRRFLERSGWKVVNLDYRDYIESERNGRELEWLQDELLKVGIDKGGHTNEDNALETSSCLGLDEIILPPSTDLESDVKAFQPGDDTFEAELIERDSLSTESNDWMQMTVVQLKEELRNRRLKVSGRKAELIERLNSYKENTGTRNDKIL